MRTNGNAGTSRGFARELTRRALALLLILAMTLAVFPPIDLQAAAQIDQTTKIITFDGTANGDYVNRPIVINKIVAAREGWETASDGRYKIQITGTPYSVTVQGMTNVDIIFDNVTINRAQTGKTATIPQGSADEFWQASEDLGWHTSGTHYVPTCPFWIMDDSDVVVSFGGTNNVFKAGSNLWAVANKNDATTSLTRSNGNKNYYHGYAGIQISGDSSLTIEGGTVEAWGSHQLNSVTTVEQAKTTYSREFSNNSNGRPPEVSTNSWAGNDAAGGAGIGGGTYYNYTTDLEAGGGGSEYHYATPGNLTINGGTVTAIGGFKAAGIGGGVNGAMSSEAGTIIINGDPATYASNRTNVLAIGSYYAAGIGEGDSTPTGNASESFLNSYELIINGGIVEARGGFKAAGIGTTDELSNSSNNSLHSNSGLRITLNGGDIIAVSGRADGDGNATAAIGAGDGTNMNPYSISIAEGTFVRASSFSKYAISDKGVSATELPETVVDPNAYMYLAYYDKSIADNGEKEREFALYEIKRTDAGDFMVVVSVAENVLDKLTANDCYFGYEESSGQFYLVDASGTTLDVNGDGERDYLAYNENLQSFSLMRRNPEYNPEDSSDTEYFLYTNEEHNRLVPANIKALQDTSHVSYYFISPAMKVFDVPPDYTAVAMTLYDPTLYGGRYILYVPEGKRNNTQLDAIYAVIEKRESGESSGELKISDDSHFDLVKDKPAIRPGNGGVIPDETSNPLTDLIVFTGNTKHLGKANATVTFTPGTKSYELWLPLGTTSIEVAALWNTADNSEVELMIGTATDDWETETDGHYIASDIRISSENPLELWITKTDTKNYETYNSVRYKVVVSLKSDYEAVLTDPSKTYDGHEIQQGIDSFVTNHVETTKITDELQSGGGATSDVAQKLDSFPTPANMNRQNIKYSRNGNLTVNVTFGKTTNRTDNTVTITTNIKASNGNNPNVSYDTVFKYDENNGTWVISQKPNGTFTYNNYYSFTVSVTDDQQLQVKSGNYDAVILFAYEITNTPTPDSQNTRPDAIEAATEEAKQLLQESGAQMEATSSKHGYVVDERVASSITLSRGNTSYGTATVTKTEQSTGTISVTVARALAGDSAELLAQATDIQYTYEKIKTPSGTPISKVFDGDTLPTEAGTYRVDVKIVAPKFEASGEREFVIKQKPTTILAIENWRYYLDDIPDPGLVNAPIDITYDEDGTSGAEVTSGAIRYDGVLEADRTDLRLDITVGGYPKMYFADRVAGEMEPDKIIIYANLPPDGNYTFADYPDADSAGKLQTEGDHVGQYLFDIAGQVSYRVNGAMFGKYAGESPWYKFYPVTDLSDPSNYTNALWMDAQGKWLDKDGVPGPDDTRIDYHSPDNQSHAEYLYFHTVNEGAEAARYAVDITYGSLSFSYTKTIWDVNNLHYADAGNPNQEADSNLENVASIWSDPQPTGETVHGKALYSNSILIENRSNRPVWYEAIVQLDFHHTMHKYNENMDEETIKHQDNVLARLFYTYYNESNGIYTMANDPKMVHTGNTGYATTERVILPAVSPQDYNATLTAEQLRDTLPYSLLEMRLLGVPQVTADVGTLTICIYPTAS